MMIERLKGLHAVTLPTGILIDVNGVGYGVEMPLRSLCDLPPVGSEITVWTYTYVREDALKLFGFLNYEDRQAFEVLISVSGVGPKMGLAILSTIEFDDLCRAILHDQGHILEKVPGIGKRLAEKILVDLKPKIRKLQLGILTRTPEKASVKMTGASAAKVPPEVDEEYLDAVFMDLHSALENLGFRERDTQPIMNHLRKNLPSLELQDLMREALRALGGHQSSKTGNKASLLFDKQI